MDYLSLCLIAKDEDEYLQEWLDYHILIGVERFYIYDNESKNPIRDLLKDYIDAGWVVVHEIDGTAVQVMAYQHCLQVYGGNSKWIGFIDADEFIVLTKEKDVKQFLHKYEPYGGLAISSVFFGSGGHKVHPVGGQIINYQERFPLAFEDNQLVKSIVQPGRIQSSLSPHDFIYKEPYYCVNSKKFRVDSQRFPVCHDEIRVHHYFMRSEAAFQNKLNRLGGAGRQLDANKMKFWKSIPMQKDVEIQIFITALLGVSDQIITNFLINSHSFKQFLHDNMKEKMISKECIKPKNKKITVKEFTPYHFVLNKQITQAKSNQDWKYAKKLLLKSIELLPMTAIRYTGYASTCLILNELDEARKTLEIALSKFGKTYEITRVVSDYWVIMKQYHKAEACFFEMLAIGEELDTLSRMAFVQIKQKKYSEAVEWGKLVVEKYLFSDSLDNDFNHNVLLDCIRIFNYLERGEEAIAMISKLRIRFPEESLFLKS